MSQMPVEQLVPQSTSSEPNRELSEQTLLSENQQLKREVADLRERLMQAQKLSSIGALASSITHEFNNILTTVINYGKMGMRHKDAATRDKAFDKIVMAGQRASKITTGMLSYARAKGDHREPQSLAQLLQDVIVLVEKDLQIHRIRVEMNVLDQPYAQVNSGQVQQVLLNLIINARQAMDGGGTLTLTVQENEADKMGEITIRDTGCGMTGETLQKIFQPFFSTKEADRQGQGGTGLGLSLCKEVIESHSGRIRVESTVGRGTAFTLRFPLVPPPTFIRPASVAKIVS
ncbi:MAG: ATP-binding protein [Planctomycetaceae bacterium]